MPPVCISTLVLQYTLYHKFHMFAETILQALARNTCFD